MTPGFRQVDPEALQRLLEDSGVSYRTSKRSYIFTCPRCSKPGKLMMFRADGRFICWVCAETSGFKGRAEFALTELLGLPINSIREKIYGEHFGELEEGAFSIQLADYFDEDEEIPADLVAQAKGIQYPLDFYPLEHEFARKGRAYMEKRGVPLDVAKRYDLRYCPVQQRVIFPIKVGPKLLGWQARAIFPTEIFDEETGETRKIPKILTTGPRDTVLMFQDNLVGSEHAVLCEGPVDAIKCHLVGGAVASMGKVVSRRQIDIICRSGVKRVYLGLDPDAATETMKLLAAFGELEIYRLLPLPGYEDLGDMPLEAVREAFSLAVRVFPGQLFLHLGA